MRISHPLPIDPIQGMVYYDSAQFEAYRFPEAMKIWFVSLKLLFGFICLMIAILFYLRPFRDLYAAIFYVVGIAYSITFSWFAPLYEIAFLQIALGSAFFPVTRKWLFPVIFGIGQVGHLLTYYLQNLWGGRSPNLANINRPRP